MSRRKRDLGEPVDEIGPDFFDAMRLTDYRIKVECPICGGAVGFVTKLEHRPEQVEDQLAEHAHADRIGWPPRPFIEREIAKLQRRPVIEDGGGPGAEGWHGRAGRVRAARTG